MPPAFSSEREPMDAGPTDTASLVAVRTLPIPTRRRRGARVMRSSLSNLRNQAQTFLRKPPVVATATVAAAVVTEVGLHLLTQGKLTPSKVVTGQMLARATPRTPHVVSTTVTEVLTITKKIHTTRTGH